MLNRINKFCISKSCSRKTEECKSLLSTILQNSFTMPFCSFCKGWGIPSYQVSSLDSSCCAKCIRLNCSRCDIQSVSSSKLYKIAI
ncbi:hypothetical protein M406DRAFT_270297 [Cryphonectria parasitica EP155]|uniref:Uncharacterized protein n=1 Tax=Cryphonectria parasitica (strain ATCC 38755 / EP155) TaxID=660469 RepID=A0A9P4XRX2_CRYP1|nr:uncharacterized protein M406DRAFT_270297 [Cryphonectria parasitica EP155]KAF3759852.1 hypothetical protein M406DRAFT_270297 [Cryphonectria parasitica EP155]